ncbi:MULTISPECIES: LysM domain-containing protein [unclassified Paenibacillus]|uniref:LysM peptidoglycan-binding domain-containing protein n=1 Tax=unclassified Paenibacillus TaxID=185978 RepID=UPI002783AE1D|nr:MULTISPECIES: LysM domain-containing protein [unclassified Paenibacillus]MDQ0902524.1 LysM repeat protein [Paenibacillus sp. V4I7]MDQ0918966.1 LysM repeat protein [Paenibacillus sp. V4I5]
MRVITNKGALQVKGRFYIVQFGDSLYTVSHRFGVNVADLLTFNDQLNGLTTIYPGEILYIPVLSLQTGGQTQATSASIKKQTKKTARRG